jgi:cell division protein FtsB
VLVALGVAAMGLFMALRDDESGLRAWWALRADLRAAEARIEGLRAEVADLERNSGGLAEDPFALERAIRERLELARPGETLVRLSPREMATPRIP